MGSLGEIFLRIDHLRITQDISEKWTHCPGKWVWSALLSFNCWEKMWLTSTNECLGRKGSKGFCINKYRMQTPILFLSYMLPWPGDENWNWNSAVWVGTPRVPLQDTLVWVWHWGSKIAFPWGINDSVPCHWSITSLVDPPPIWG